MPRALEGPTIHFESRGKGRPFVMLHGSPNDHRSVLSYLEPAFRPRKGWRRFYPDLPGHGRSPGSSRIHDLDDYLEVVDDFVARVAGSRPVALGGHSFGAYLALALARRHPKRVRGLLLSSPEVHHDARDDRLDAQWKRAHPNFVPPYRLPADYREDTAWLTGLPWKGVSVDLYDPRKVLDVPTLLLFGRQDAPHRAETYARILGAFPQATYAVLGGAGHALWRQKGDLARSLVSDWLDRMEA